MQIQFSAPSLHDMFCSFFRTDCELTIMLYVAVPLWADGANSSTTDLGSNIEKNWGINYLSARNTPQQSGITPRDESSIPVYNPALHTVYFKSARTCAAYYLRALFEYSTATCKAITTLAQDISHIYMVW